MKTRELTDISYDIADLSATIGLMQNYISCLSLQAAKSKNNDDRLLFFLSLTNEKGLSNIMDNLVLLDKKIKRLSDEVLDYAEVSA